MIFTKRRLVIFLILFAVSFMYVPTIKCLEDQAVKESTCTAMGLCETDLYFSLAMILLGGCPAGVNPWIVTIWICMMILGTGFSAYGLDFLYSKYRDV